LVCHREDDLWTVYGFNSGEEVGCFYEAELFLVAVVLVGGAVSCIFLEELLDLNAVFYE
jgi:hypothetical protein